MTTGRLIAWLRVGSSRLPALAIQTTRNGFALFGIAIACMLVAIAARPDIRSQGESQLREWLQSRQTQDADSQVALDSDEAPEPVASVEEAGLPKDQARLAHWLSKKYRVAQQPLSVLVGEAYELGTKAKLDPTLILAVMAIESRFNPFAQSPVGAQGLMQVMTRIHADKYEDFGGDTAAFDPVANLRVGVLVLQECIRRAGSLEGGLRYYVGAANLSDDGGYAAKVLAEQFRLRQVASGRSTRAQPPAPRGTLTTKAAPSVPSVDPEPASVIPVGTPGSGGAVTEKVAMLGQL